ncbi:MAG: class I SAM-dependent methyltransferase [Sandaracinaceae bacterium]|nr:class I SAM-dependent methyltransferase [Sandaracinaceae bacterium]
MFHPKGPTFLELAQQALSSTDRGYDLIARKFDYTPFRTPDAILEQVAREIGPEGSVARGLDLCCGTGAGLRWIRPLCREVVVGLDRSEGMLEEARRRLADAPGSAPIELVRGDALEPPLATRFDLVTCFGAFGHILEADEPRLVDRIATLLVPGGRFVFVTGRMPPIWSPQLWLARGFNAAMHVRNALVSPPFVMYYLTFLLPSCQELLESRGFDVEVRSDVFPEPFRRVELVLATLRSRS